MTYIVLYNTVNILVYNTAYNSVSNGICNIGIFLWTVTN